MAEMNQCDGCRRGLPARDGNHYDGERPVMGCTASRYAPVAGADPRADGWRRLAATCIAFASSARSPHKGALADAAAALRDAAEAVTEAREHEAEAARQANTWEELYNAAAARGAEGERGAFVAGFRRAAYVYSDQEENDADVTERAEREWSERPAPRPSAGPAGGVSAEVAIVVALARCGMGANPTVAVRHQIQRLAAAWRAAGHEGEAARLDAVLAPAPDELRGVRLVQSQEVGDASAARASDDPARLPASVAHLGEAARARIVAVREHAQSSEMGRGPLFHAANATRAEYQRAVGALDWEAMQFFATLAEPARRWCPRCHRDRGRATQLGADGTCPLPGCGFAAPAAPEVPRG